ncbi:MAG: beta-galactosidase, partial [Myxococcota bacterium]
MIQRVAALVLCIAPMIGQAEPPETKGPPETKAPPEKASSGPNKVVVSADKDGAVRLNVDGSDFMVFGMNWGYIPVGENYRYDLWTRDEAFIKRVLDREMALLKDMGVNAIRLFNTIPPKWVTYIYTNYGIFTAVNHLAGRYGFVVDGALMNPVDYSDKKTRAAIVADIAKTAARYKDVPGVLMYLIGNENNYGLVWKSFEIEALPAEEQNHAKAVHLYSLFGEAIAAIKAEDPGHPIAIVNGDLGYIDLIAKYCADMDIMGANVYRGPSSRDLFAKVREVLKKPFLYTEFGSDAYNAKEQREDHLAQAQYLREQWQEIYEQSAGKGREGNAIGGFIFQWSDGWWKYKQETNLDVHDNNASWPNAGYPHDYVEGENNMNEEWFGLAAKGPNDET